MSVMVEHAASVQTWRRRENILPGIILIIVALAAWVYTFYQPAMLPMSGMAAEQQAAAMPDEMQPREAMTGDSTMIALGVFLLGWTVMMVAMMLPGALPIVLMYRIIARRSMSANRSTLALAALLAGYLGIWALAGLPVYAYTLIPPVRASSVAVAPAVLLIIGGVYQFTALKRGCHGRCSSPLMFLMRRCRPGIAGAARLGILHGIDCLGCCAGLMLALAALGMMNLALMLTAASIIFIEKALPWGHRVARPLGSVLVLGGFLLLVTSLRGMAGAM